MLTNTSGSRLFYLLLLASVPILMINLGAVPFIEDEGIRSLVALEMDLSGNLITPTLNGEYYYKKPPLWNWIVLLSFKLTGQINEWGARLPMLVCLYAFTLSIFWSFRRHVSVDQAALTALCFLTCGRILFWDSMLALIDICFSWVVFLLFVWIIEKEKSKNYLALYLGAYLLTALAFMLKALPAIVFLGFTLLAVQIQGRSWKKLLSWQHGIGIGAFLSVIGLYLLAYHQYHPLQDLLAVFLDESTRRTAIEYGLIDTLRQMISFPLEMIYHFLPWSLALSLLLVRDLRKLLLDHAFMRAILIVFAANIWIYWISPQVYPRYLFMLMPLVFGLAMHLYHHTRSRKIKRLFEWLLFALGAAVTLGSVLLIFNPETSAVPGLLWKWGLTAGLMAVLLILMLRFRSYYLYLFCAFLFAARLGFSLIVLPARAVNSAGALTRTDALRIGQQWKDQDLYIYRSDTMRYEASFYLTKERGRVLPIREDAPAGSYLLVNPTKFSTLIRENHVLDSIRVRRSEEYTYLIKTAP